MRKIYAITLLLLLTSSLAQGQCNILTTAVAGIFLDYQSTNLLNCSGVAFNPIQGRYYGVRAGNPTYPLETWSTTGVQLFSTTAGFDWRGMWWNPNTQQLEGNGYLAEGIWKCNLDGNGWATSTGVSIFTGQAQPDMQSVGDYDPSANEILYFFNGSIYRYSRATNVFIGSYPLLGIPTSLININNNTVMYTGCAGKEIAILNYVNRRIYLFEKNTGVFVGTSQLPATAVCSSSFRTSYANGLVWLFNLSLGNWYSYRVLDNILPENAFSANTIWFNTTTAQIDWESSDASRYQRFEVERSLDGRAFEKIGDKDARDATLGNGATKSWTLQDASTPSLPLIYYRVNAILKTGESEISDVMVLSRTQSSELALGAWPIPADQVVNLSFEHALAGSQLEVIDAAGKLVRQQTLSESLETSGGMQLDSHNWADGVYLLRLRDLQGHQVSQRLVVQH